MKMKRKLEKEDTNENQDDQDTSTKSRKKKKKIKEEFTEEFMVDEVGEAFSEDMTDQSFEESKVFAEPFDVAGSKKKKKKKKKKTDTDDECSAETGDGDEMMMEVVEIKTENPNGIIKDVWPKEKILKLLNNMVEVIPENDNLKYRSRVAKIDWGAVSFESYTPAECEAMWKCIQDKTRCFRILKEVVNDAKEAIQQSSSLFYHGMVKDKHPEMPQKPLSSFMLFYMDMKDKIVQEFPGINCPDLAKKVSEQWKALSQKKADKYKYKAQALRTLYEEKLAEFYAKHPEFVEEKKKKTKSNSDSLGFEKPKTAFQLYYHSCRDEAERKHSQLSGLALLEKTKENWKNMPEDSKVVWIEAAQAEEKKYRDTLKKYELEHPGFEMPVVKPLLTKNDRNILENISGRPKKPPSNAYSLYSQRMLQSVSLKKLPSKERLSEISRRWKALGAEERARYALDVKKLQEIYKKQYDEFLNALPEEKRIQEEAKNRVKRKRGQTIRTVVEPEKPPTNVIEFYKLRNQNEWKKKSPKANVDEMAKKKWRTLPKTMKSEYFDELRKVNEKYIDDYAKFLQACPSSQCLQYLLEFTEHKKKVDEFQNIRLNDGDEE